MEFIYVVIPSDQSAAVAVEEPTFRTQPGSIHINQ